MRVIQLLDAQHRRVGFDCGDVELNNFRLRQAGQQQRHGFGKTYVALAEDDTEVTGKVLRLDGLNKKMADNPCGFFVAHTPCVPINQIAPMKFFRPRKLLPIPRR